MRSSLNDRVGAIGEAEACPRVCVVSARNISRAAFQCGQLEAQDVLDECGEADLVCLEAERSFRHKQPWLRRLMYRDVTRTLAYANPGVQGVTLTGQYDLFVVMCQTYWDFLYVNAIKGWEEHCKASLCWMDELWAASLGAYRYWLPSLKRFDHVVVGMQGTVTPLSEVLGKQCHYVPGGVDALRFSPGSNPPERVIDVYSMGRRWDGVHQALLKQAAHHELFYLYDSLQNAESQAASHRQHRDLYANIAKRTKFFTVAPGKAALSSETQGQVEIGFRYYEGAAAGAVMVGQAPDSEMFRTMFDWPDVVIPLKPDGSDTKSILKKLMAQPDRLQEVSRRNVQGALLRHDWIYRWRKIFEIAGLRPGEGMEQRECGLRALSCCPSSTLDGPAPVLCTG
jgi:hypothetical protein